jgi:hypothetical protein
MKLRDFANVTLTSLVTMTGDHYYSLLKGSSNQFTFVMHLRQLTVSLDRAQPGWRETSVVLVDNHGMHKTPEVQREIKKLRIPVMYTG